MELGDGTMCKINSGLLLKIFFVKTHSKSENHRGWINPFELVSLLIFPEIELILR